jgi:hypothetical protein
MKSGLLLLLVPLALASFGLSALAPQQSPSAHVWRQSQKADTFRGFTYTQFTLTGKFTRSPQSQDDVSNRPALVVDCIPGKGTHRPKGKFLAGNLLVGTTLKIEYIEPQEIHGTSYLQKVSVRYRTDDAKEEEEKWSPGADKTSASVPKAVLKKILRAHAVEITATDDRGAQLVMQFDMPDATPVEDGCNVDERKE